MVVTWSISSDLENIASENVEPLFSRLIFLFSYSHLGWFARDPKILSRVGHVLLQSPQVTPVKPTQVIIAEDCFQLSSVPYEVVPQTVIKVVQKLYGGKCLISIQYIYMLFQPILFKLINFVDVSIYPRLQRMY